MNTDIELDAWRAEWRERAAPLPDLRRRIRRENLRMAGAAVMLVVCLAASTLAGLRSPGSFWAGMATGVWATALLVGTYAVWVRRGAWRPSAQTTQAYLELSARRGVAKERTLRLAFRLLLVALASYSGYLALSARRIEPREWVIVILMVLEVFLFVHLRRRNRRGLEETRGLIELTSDGPAHPTPEGGELQP